jgi:hypothetical protein
MEPASKPGGSIMRSVAGLIIGAIACFVVILVFDGVNSIIYPLPPGVSPSDPQAMKDHIATLPVTAFLVLLLGWFAGVLVGSFVAAKIAGRAPLIHAVIIGALFLVATVANLLLLSHPLWMWPAAILLLPAATLLAARLASGGRRQKP